MCYQYSETPDLLGTVDVLLGTLGLEGCLIKDLDEYKGICPFCGKDGFYFHIIRRSYGCSACGEVGRSILDFVIRYPGIDVSDECEAWFWLARMMHTEKKKGRPVDMRGWTFDDEF